MSHAFSRIRAALLLAALATVPGLEHCGRAQAEHGPSGTAKSTPGEDQAAAERLREDRREFQSQELMLAKAGTWIFPPGQTPRILWRDPETVARLGCRQPLHVRWFDAKLNESPSPDAPGRWIAWIEGTAPNGTPLRRSLTFYAIPKEAFGSYSPDLSVTLPHFPGSNAPAAVKEHQAEILRLANDTVVRAMLESERGAALVAGLAEAKPLGRPARYVESAVVTNEDYHLAIKLKLQGMEGQVRHLRPPRRCDPPAIVLHEGSAAEAGVGPDAKQRIDAVCRAWAEDSGEPFVTLVARRGVIVTHEAFGQHPGGKPIRRDYRCWVASITKTVTGILFSRFLDQGLIDLDAPVAKFFPDYDKNDPHVPTFRQCFTHTSGLSGHGDFGGMRNPQFENVVLNGLDVNRPGSTYAYSGQGFELAVKAMEIAAGQSAVHLYDEHLFRPLGFGDVPIGSASADGEFTAMELGILAQWVANRGSYGRRQFIRPETFERLMPRPVCVADHSYTEDEGIGMHWVRHLKEGAPRGSKKPEDLLFGPRTLGHGSLSGCVFVVDPDAQLVITQVRKHSGPRSAEWSPKFFRAIAAGLEK